MSLFKRLIDHCVGLYVDLLQGWKIRAGKSVRPGLLLLAVLLFGISLFTAVDGMFKQNKKAALYANRDGYTLVQTYKEIERFIDALQGYVLQDPADSLSYDELLLRFERLTSRLPLLMEGEAGKRISAFPGVIQVAEELKQSLLEMEPLFETLRPGANSPSYEAIRWELLRYRDAFFALSREFLLRSDVYESIIAGELEDNSGYWQFAAVILSGLLLVLLLVTQFRHSLRASAALAQEPLQSHRAKQELSYQATHDALTGLINRAEMERRLQRVFASVQATGDEGALLYLDLDRFRALNDTCGHLAGDQLLRQIATLLRGKVRKRDTLARMGGDELVLLLEHCPLPEALRVAEGILQALREFRFVWQGKIFTIGISIGIAPVSFRSDSPATVLMAADRACYTAKGVGGNCARIYLENIPVSEWRDEQTLWAKRIEQGLADNRFRLYSQTIYPLTVQEGKGEHYEIFLRLEDEAGRLASPEAFFSTAERYHLMTDMDRWVIRHTFAWLGADAARLDSLGLCFINLSAPSLADTELYDFIVTMLAQSLVPAHKVCFEIGEEAVMSNLGGAIDLIKSLKTVGCRFALDDFGAGMSTFAYLKLLPVDFIKIDGGLVRDIVKDPVDSALVHAINEIGQVMGKRTIAESVESIAIREKLRRIGVNFVQGYSLSRPRPLEEGQFPAIAVV